MHKWYKLDNAAKLFPAVTNRKNSSVFRVSAVLKEPVDKNILQKTVNHVYDRFPMMFVKIRRGFFWQYFDSTRDAFYVCEETGSPCGVINPYENNGYLLKILYFGNRVSVEVFHALTDGGGAAEFLKTIVYYYLCFSGNGALESERKVLLTDDEFLEANMEDSFLRHYERLPTGQTGQAPGQNAAKSEGAFQVRGTPYEPRGQNVTTALLSADALRKAAKARNATVTAYLASLLIYAIYRAKQKDSADKKPIRLDVPVSLRSRFQSGTLRNFFAVVSVGMKVNGHTKPDDIVQEITRQLKAKTERPALLRVMAKNMRFEKTIYSRIVPLFLKKALIMIGFNIWGEFNSSMTLSNLGEIPVPSGFEPRVSHFETVMYTTAKSPVRCGVCSVNGKLAVSLSRSVTEADIVKQFVQLLAGDCEVEVYSNDWGRGYA